MNVFEKLQKARVDLQKKELKKSGKNTYSNYDYFQLADFLPELNEIMDEKKLCSMVTFENDCSAKLTIIDCEKPEDTICFTSPAASVSLKGAHDIQNLGAMQTYQRRYLYMAAFEIVEDDAIDPLPKNTQGEKHKEPQKDAKAEAISGIMHKAKELGMSNKDIQYFMYMKFNVESSDKMTLGQAKALQNNLEKWWKEESSAKQSQK